MRGLSEILRLFVFSIYSRVGYTLSNERRVDVMLKFRKKKENKPSNVDTEIKEIIRIRNEAISELKHNYEELQKFTSKDVGSK